MVVIVIIGTDYILIKMTTVFLRGLLLAILMKS